MRAYLTICMCRRLFEFLIIVLSITSSKLNTQKSSSTHKSGSTHKLDSTHTQVKCYARTDVLSRFSLHTGHGSRYWFETEREKRSFRKLKKKNDISLLRMVSAVCHASGLYSNEREHWALTDNCLKHIVKDFILWERRQPRNLLGI